MSAARPGGRTERPGDGTMSLIQDLGALLRAASAELPLGKLASALDRLRSGSTLLMWVRQQSSYQLGVPELGGAIEHLEHAAHALRVAQDSVSGYLTALGLGVDPAVAREPEARLAPEPPVEASVTVQARPAPRLGRWWADRVAYLTDGAAEPEPEPGTGGSTGASLLRRVAGRTRDGDRDGLRRELVNASAPVGLGLSAAGGNVLRRLAGQLLGHEPRAGDLPTLTGIARERVLAMLPKLPPDVVDTLLARACRVPPPGNRVAPHPADSAVASGVLVGVLLDRLGGDPDSLAPDVVEA